MRGSGSPPVEVGRFELVQYAAGSLDRFGIFTVHRDGVASGSCVRVMPSPASAPDDLDRLVAALERIVAEG